MKQAIKSAVTRVLGLAGAYPTELTPRRALQSLITRLRPLSTAVPLIRLGPDGDGGYLVPDDLAGIEACFSPGVCTVSGFERDCAELGLKVFLADGSVEHPAETHAAFAFTKKFVGATTNEKFMTLDDWVASSLPGSGSDLLLQIDIEGYEYETFLSMSSRLLKRLRIIVVEFHRLDQLWSRPFFSLASPAFEKLLESHSCVHVHPNNSRKAFRRSGLSIPPVVEFTFLRNDRVRDPRPATQFPHALDFDNTSNPHLALPECWYTQG